MFCVCVGSGKSCSIIRARAIIGEDLLDSVANSPDTQTKLYISSSTFECSIIVRTF